MLGGDHFSEAFKRHIPHPAGDKIAISIMVLIVFSMLVIAIVVVAVKKATDKSIPSTEIARKTYDQPFTINGKNQTALKFENGNLALLKNNNIVWQTNTNGSKLVMQDDGNLVIYSSDNNALWSSGTGHSTQVKAWFNPNIPSIEIKRKGSVIKTFKA